MSHTNFVDPKIGDVVILYTSRDHIEGRITHVTTARIKAKGKLGGGLYSGIFNRRTGRQIGSTWRNGMSISLPEGNELQEINEMHEGRRLIRRLNEMDWRRLSIEALRAMVALLPTEDKQ